MNRHAEMLSSVVQTAALDRRGRARRRWIDRPMFGGPRMVKGRRSGKQARATEDDGKAWRRFYHPGVPSTGVM